MVESAHIGQPPATEEDYYIVRSYLRLAPTYGGRFDADPTSGFQPGMRPPHGYVYNDKQAGILAALAVMLVVIFTLSATRLGLRHFKQRLKWGPDDWAIIPATLCMMLYIIFQMLVVTRGGGGKHIWDITYAEFARFMEYGFCARLVFYIGLWIAKISICLFNRRLTVIASRSWKIGNDILLFICVFFALLSVFWQAFQCNPPRAMFSKVYDGKLAKPAKCWNMVVIGRTLSYSHVIVDFMLLVTPVIVIWKVKMPKSKKIRLYGLFSIGTISCIAATLRDRLSVQVQFDTTYSYTVLISWAIVDMTMTILVANLPVMNVLFAGRHQHGEVRESNIESLAHISSLAASRDPAKISVVETRRDGQRDVVVGQEDIQVVGPSKEDLEKANQEKESK